MDNKTKWTVGLALCVVALLVSPFTQPEPLPAVSIGPGEPIARRAEGPLPNPAPLPTSAVPTTRSEVTPDVRRSVLEKCLMASGWKAYGAPGDKTQTFSNDGQTWISLGTFAGDDFPTPIRRKDLDLVREVGCG